MAVNDYPLSCIFRPLKLIVLKDIIVLKIKLGGHSSFLNQAKCIIIQMYASYIYSILKGFSIKECILFDSYWCKGNLSVDIKMI